MSVDVRGEVLIDRPREKVAEIMFNPKCDKLWMTGLTRVFPMTAGDLATGSKVEHIGDFLGRRFSRIALVIRDEPNSFLEFSADEPYLMKIRYELKDVESGTRVKIRIQSVAIIEFPMPAATVVKATQEKVDADLRKLKKHLEENT
jgi:hypothetical protein